MVTPRIGKPVEVNALRVMAEFARLLGEPLERYETLAEQARTGFGRFWNEEAGYCYDVLDGPDGNDPALRPNQLFAVSLPHSPLTPEQQKSVVDAGTRSRPTACAAWRLGILSTTAISAVTAGPAMEPTTRGRCGDG